MRQETKVQSKKLLTLLLGVALLLVISVAAFVWQQGTIVSLNKQIEGLAVSQVPQRMYASYEDCMNNGGVILNTINGQFDACMGGNEDETGEVPQYQAFLQYSAQNLPRLETSKKSKKENKVIVKGNYSADLVTFLKSDYTGCDTRGEYEIIKEVPGRFAMMKYGCDNGEQLQSSDNYSAIIAMKLSDGWRLLSPTNNMDKMTPSCLLVDTFKISKKLSSKCFENTGYSNGRLKAVAYQ